MSFILSFILLIPLVIVCFFITVLLYVLTAKYFDDLTEWFSNIIDAIGKKK